MAFPAIMVVAAFMDLFTMRISNKLSILLVAVFCVAALFSGMAWEQFGYHVLTGFAVLIIGIGLFSFGLLGGGDAKLLAAASLWIGYVDLPVYLLTVTVFGGLLAVAVLIYRFAFPPHWAMNWEWTERLHQPKGGIPYGVALTAGVLWILPQSQIFNTMTGA